MSLIDYNNLTEDKKYKLKSYINNFKESSIIEKYFIYDAFPELASKSLDTIYNDIVDNYKIFVTENKNIKTIHFTTGLKREDNYLIEWLNINNINFKKSKEKAEVLILSGGSDINPAIYGHPAHKSTHFSVYRDEEEIEAYYDAINKGIPVIGICRGMQLLSALNGASLIQDVDNHSGPNHKIKVFDENNNQLIFNVNSLHHQMVNPFNLPDSDYEILGYSENIATYYTDGYNKNVEMPLEPEIIYFPKTKCFGIQCHPEMMSFNSYNSFLKYLNNIIKHKLNLNL